MQSQRPATPSRMTGVGGGWRVGRGEDEEAVGVEPVHRAAAHLCALAAAGWADEHNILARRRLQPALELGEEVQRGHCLWQPGAGRLAPSSTSSMIAWCGGLFTRATSR